jgi:hypothetical protein
MKNAAKTSTVPVRTIDMGYGVEEVKDPDANPVMGPPPPP